MISVWSFTETEYRLDVEGSIELVWKSLCGESSPMVSSPVMELQNPCHGGAISQSNNEGKVHCKDNKSMSFFYQDDYCYKKESIFQLSLSLCRHLGFRPVPVVLGNF